MNRARYKTISTGSPKVKHDVFAYYLVALKDCVQL
jgi:hypothetical protein